MSVTAKEYSTEIDSSGFESSSQKDRSGTFTPDDVSWREKRIAQIATIFEAKKRGIVIVISIVLTALAGRFLWAAETHGEEGRDFQMSLNLDAGYTEDHNSEIEQYTSTLNEILVQSASETVEDVEQGVGIPENSAEKKEAKAIGEAKRPAPIKERVAKDDTLPAGETQQSALTTVKKESSKELEALELKTETQSEATAPVDFSDGRNDLIDAILFQVALQDYPTRDDLKKELSKVHTISKEDIDSLFVGLKKQASKISQLEAKLDALDDTRSLTEKMVQNTKEHTARFATMEKGLKKLQKNWGWHQNRLTELEKGSAEPAQKTVSNPDTSSSEWSLNGATDNLAFVQNNQSRERLRVTPGIEIPGCGEVTGISPADQKVTTTSCVISN